LDFGICSVLFIDSAIFKQLKKAEILGSTEEEKGGTEERGWYNSALRPSLGS
jgi:hypothetical protein